MAVCNNRPDGVLIGLKNDLTAIWQVKSSSDRPAGQKNGSEGTLNRADGLLLQNFREFT